MADRSIEALIARREAGLDAPDPRTDIDTASLIARYPELGRSAVENSILDGPYGSIPLRIYTPKHPTDVALMWVHGGAFIGGDLDSPEANWTSLALAARGITVVSVDYRKALNGVHFPIPSDEVFTAWQWAVKHFARTQLSSTSLHLGGASAGGNLAAGVTKRLRDCRGTMPASLLLLYPTLHYDLVEASDDACDALIKFNPTERYPANQIRAMYLQYLGDAGLKEHPYAVPACGSLSGLPRMLVVTSEADDLRSSGEEFAKRVMVDGGEVELRTEPGSTHGHLDRPHDPTARSTIDRMVAWLERKL